jgi:hypothetical protein
VELNLVPGSSGCLCRRRTLLSLPLPQLTRPSLAGVAFASRICRCLRSPGTPFRCVRRRWRRKPFQQRDGHEELTDDNGDDDDHHNHHHHGLTTAICFPHVSWPSWRWRQFRPRPSRLRRRRPRPADPSISLTRPPTSPYSNTTPSTSRTSRISPIRRSSACVVKVDGYLRVSGFFSVSRQAHHTLQAKTPPPSSFPCLPWGGRGSPTTCAARTLGTGLSTSICHRRRFIPPLSCNVHAQVALPDDRRPTTDMTVARRVQT